VRLALARDPALAAEIARRILNAHFPESIRQDVANALGVSLDAFASKLAPTGGHDLRMGGNVIGLEATHIKWFQARGSDVVQNGLALCSLHH
jgi:putative restriction endonuclease